MTPRFLAAITVYLWMMLVFACFGGLITLLCASTIMLVCFAIWTGTPNERGGTGEEG